jgi:hypothetical protein
MALAVRSRLKQAARDCGETPWQEEAGGVGKKGEGVFRNEQKISAGMVKLTPILHLGSGGGPP